MQSVSVMRDERAPESAWASGPDANRRWVKASLAVLALLCVALVGAATATVITLKAIIPGEPTTAPPPSPGAVHDANVKLCTLYYTASEPMANWTREQPPIEQKNGTAGASVFLVTANFLVYALDQTPDADKDLRANVQAVAQASIDSAGVYSGQPEGLIQTPTFVPRKFTTSA